MKALKLINAAISFLLELAMLVAFSIWALNLRSGLAIRIVVAVAVVATAIILWGIFAAPKSSKRLKQLYLSFFILVMFGLAALALLASGHPGLAGSFSIIGILNVVLAYAWKQEEIFQTK